MVGQVVQKTYFNDNTFSTGSRIFLYLAPVSVFPDSRLDIPSSVQYVQSPIEIDRNHMMSAQSGYIRLSSPVFHIHDLCPQADKIPVHVDAMTIPFCCSFWSFSPPRADCMDLSPHKVETLFECRRTISKYESRLHGDLHGR